MALLYYSCGTKAFWPVRVFPQPHCVHSSAARPLDMSIYEPNLGFFVVFVRSCFFYACLFTFCRLHRAGVPIWPAASAFIAVCIHCRSAKLASSICFRYRLHSLQECQTGRQQLSSATCRSANLAGSHYSIRCRLFSLQECQSGRQPPLCSY